MLFNSYFKYFCKLCTYFQNCCFINFNKIHYNFNDVYVKLINLTSKPSLNFSLTHQSQIFQAIPRLSRAVIMGTNAENARGLGRDPSPFPRSLASYFHLPTIREPGTD